MLLRTHPEVDGIYCGSDLIARGVADSVRELGRAVPRDVALIGTDNWEIIATGARPPLTTVDTGLAEVGRLAAEKPRCDRRPSAPGRQQVAPQLVIRGSTDTGAA